MIDKSKRKFLDLTLNIAVFTGLSLLANVEKQTKQGHFLHGVASGDPLQDRVIIWTRITPFDSKINEITVTYELSLEKSFNNIIRSGKYIASKNNDFTVKVDVKGLKPDTKYYYRFISKNITSMTGRTQTLPQNTEKITLAIFSCANYTNGYFNAYQDACKFSKINAVIHLGDYIYEYGMFDNNGNNAYGTKNAKKINREFPDNNNQELLTLDDYRKRYALYRQDPSLQELHALQPFICIWDDHEICNNAYNFKDNEGIRRKNAATQAYFEWLPIRIEQKNKIFRSFKFGTLFSLYMLDTRLFGRHKQLDYKDYITSSGKLDLKKFQNDYSSDSRKLLGTEQFNWLKNEFIQSKTSWQVIAQQVKVSQSNIPLEVVELATQYELTDDIRKKRIIKKNIVKTFNEIARIKARISLNDQRVSKKEKERVRICLPYNLDAWDGYSKERENLYDILKNYSKKNIILSGDAHYSWCDTLVDNDNNTIGVEIGVTSVTSPGIEEDYHLEDLSSLKELESSTALFDQNSLYSNYINRGYVVLEVERDKVTSHWRYMKTINKRDTQTLAERNKMIKIGLVNNKYYTSMH